MPNIGVAKAMRAEGNARAWCKRMRDLGVLNEVTIKHVSLSPISMRTVGELVALVQGEKGG